MKNIRSIAVRSLKYLILINLLALVGAFVLKTGCRFALSLNVISPILCGILSHLTEYSGRRQEQRE